MKTTGFCILEEVLHKYDLVLLDSNFLVEFHKDGKVEPTELLPQELESTASRVREMTRLVTYYNEEEPHICITDEIRGEMTRLEAIFNSYASSRGQVYDRKRKCFRRPNLPALLVRRFISDLAALKKALGNYKERTDTPIVNINGASAADLSLVSAYLHYLFTPREAGLYGTATIITGDCDVQAALVQTVGRLNPGERSEVGCRGPLHWYAQKRPHLERMVYEV